MSILRNIAVAAITATATLVRRMRAGTTRAITRATLHIRQYAKKFVVIITVTAKHARRHARKLALVAFAIIVILVLKWIVEWSMARLNTLGMKTKESVLDKIASWVGTSVEVYWVIILLPLLGLIFLWWAYRKRNSSVVSATVATSPATPARTTPPTAARPVVWKKRVGTVIGWVVVIAVIGFLGKAGYDNYTRPGHGVVGAVGRFIWPDRTTTETGRRQVLVTGDAIIVTAPPAPEWSEVIQTPRAFSVNPEEGAIISLKKRSGPPITGIKRNPDINFGNTPTIQLQSESKTPVLVTVVK